MGASGGGDGVCDENGSTYFSSARLNRDTEALDRVEARGGTRRGTITDHSSSQSASAASGKEGARARAVIAARFASNCSFRPAESDDATALELVPAADNGTPPTPGDAEAAAEAAAEADDDDDDEEEVRDDRSDANVEPVRCFNRVAVND
jgi:hypothetical protein